MLGPKIKEPDFIERKRRWKSGLDKPIGPSLTITVLPAMLLCVFLLLAAPYLNEIVLKYLQDEQEQQVRKVDTSELPAPEAPAEPPPNPELAEAQFYRELYEAQGFDWRKKPVLEEGQEIPEAKIPVVIDPLDVELPVYFPNTSPNADSSQDAKQAE